MTLQYSLRPECLTNEEGVAGRWQIEGGRVMQDKEHIANYSCVKRTSCGTQEQNAGMLWVTLFFLRGYPPENITLQGAHDFNSGAQIGSVSAASTAYAAHIGKPFRRMGNTLNIG